MIQLVEYIPCVNSAFLMNFHFSAFIIVELLPDGCLQALKLTVNYELQKETCQVSHFVAQ